VPLDISFEDSTPTTPIFFILSPGIDPVQPVETLGIKMGFREDDNKFFNVSLGQGQEAVAEAAMEQCFSNGGWAMLNNIHLVVKWLLRLEKIMENYGVIYAKMAQIAKKKAEKRLARRRARQLAEQEKKEREARERAEQGLPELKEDDALAELEAEGEGDEEEDEEAREARIKARREKLEAERALAQKLKEEQEELEDEAEDEADPELQLEGPKGHPDFRVFLASDPSEKIPIGILQRCIKLTSEPPQGLKQNLVRAFKHFSDEPWENSSKQQEFKGILFALCFFHACIVERKKFGAQGWNRPYPFNPGDLTTCVDVLANNLEDRAKIPWEDLRYVFGEIMYGGHITDDWDRELCKAYLSYLVSHEVLEGADLCVGYTAPPPMNYREYLAYIEEATPAESPILYGVHPNAEINFRTVQGETLFRTINELASSASVGGASGASEKVRSTLDELMGSLPEPHNLIEIAERLEDDRSPAQHVFYQECERMNILVAVMRKTLTDLDLGLKGALSMSNQMQQLFEDINLNKVPESWSGVAYMSMRPLTSWYQNLLERNQQLLDFAVELMAPKVVGINLFFNPNAFLTAITQTMAMQHGYDLDQMTLTTEVTKKWPDQVDAAAREGSHVFGTYMEGARWDMSQSSIDDSRMKDLYPRMPVMTIRALPISKVDYKDLYACPVYKTQERGAGYVATLHLKTKAIARKWVIGGVALLLDVVE
jgi:dynein heavy chain